MENEREDGEDMCDFNYLCLKLTLYFFLFVLLCFREYNYIVVFGSKKVG